NIIMNNNGDTIYEKAIVDYSLNNKINIIRSPKTIESKGLILKFYNTDKKDENNSSLFFSVNNKILFTGDAYISDELEYLPNLKHHPILKVGHHGSKTSTSSDFLNKINPSISLVSVGKNNRFNHPSKEVIARLNNFYLTSENGMIYLKIDKEIKIKTKF
ncbi:MAG: hypothetical protein LRY26_01630, partial [Bacilli bacterium]|nr:hypothetical protein [Bacilli bacterium]